MYERTINHLLELYVFAIDVASPTLENAVISAFLLAQSRYKQLPGNEFIIKAYTHQAVSEDSLLQNYLVLTAAYHWLPCEDTDEERKLRDSVPNMFLYKVFEALFQIDRQSPQSPFKTDWCAFHRHGSSNEKDECKETWMRYVKEATRKRKRSLSDNQGASTTRSFGSSGSSESSEAFTTSGSSVSSGSTYSPPQSSRKEFDGSPEIVARPRRLSRPPWIYQVYGSI